jgi:hypothetical protein
MLHLLRLLSSPCGFSLLPAASFVFPADSFSLYFILRILNIHYLHFVLALALLLSLHELACQQTKKSPEGMAVL